MAVELRSLEAILMGALRSQTRIRSASRLRWSAMALVVAAVVASVPALARADGGIPPWVVDGRVNTVVQAGSRIYIGGAFTQVGQPTGYAVTVPLPGARGAAQPIAMQGRVPNGGAGVYGAAADGADGWYLTGEAGTIAGAPWRGVAHVNADGSLDRSFLASVDHRMDPANDYNPDWVGPLAVNGGMIVIGGHFRTVDGQPRRNVALLDRSGRLLPTRLDADGSVTAAATVGSTTYLAGFFSMIGGQPRAGLAAIDRSGRLTSFSASVKGVVRALAADGTRLYLAGAFSAVGDQPRTNLAAIDLQRGELTGFAPSFGCSGDNCAAGNVGLAVGDGVVYVGGAFQRVDGAGRTSAAAFSAATGELLPWDPRLLYESSPENAWVGALAVTQAGVLLGGEFSTVDGVARPSLALVDPTSGGAMRWRPPTPNLPAVVIAAGGRRVLLGGSFTRLGVQRRVNVAAFDAASGALLPWSPSADPNGAVTSVAVHGDSVYLGGDLRTVNGAKRGMLAAVSASTGTLLPWAPKPPRVFVGGPPVVRAIAVRGSTVYVSCTACVDGRRALAAIDATSGEVLPWNPRPNGSVRALLAGPDALYAAGTFTTMGGGAHRDLAALAYDGPGHAVEGFTGSAVGGVAALARRGSTLYLAGGMRIVDGAPRAALASVDISSGRLLGWHPSVVGSIDAVEIAGSRVYVGGAFTSIDGARRHGLAALDAGGRLTAFDPPLRYGAVRALAVTGDTLYAAGRFAPPRGAPMPFGVRLGSRGYPSLMIFDSASGAGR
jgi:hypothetical protein